MPLRIAIRSARADQFGATISKSQSASAHVVIIGTWAIPAGKDAAKRKLPEAIAAADKDLGGGLASVIEREEFTGKREQTLSVPTFGKLGAGRIVLLGLGDRGSAKDAELRTFGARASRIAIGEKATEVTILLPDGVEARLRPVAEGLELGAYRFTKYMTGDRIPKTTLADVSLVTTKKIGATAKKDLDAGQTVAMGVNIARDLSNEPPNHMHPVQMGVESQKVAKAHGLKVQVFDFKEIRKRGMHLIDAVGRGSANEPRVIHLSYVPAKKAKKTIVFVGKGITFDTGGISIKPAAGMGEMKHDMSGAANLVGLMATIGALKPANVEVHAILACAENMPDGDAYRPGDVWGSLDGKTVEIVNTDAEGRLVLADALAYARELKPDLLVDNATLTGAIVVALGTTCSAYYASNEATANEFGGAVKQSGETMWRMPLLEEMRDQLKSDVADLKHTGDRWGGSITAALFLREFIGETKNWVHCDIAGPMAADRPRQWDVKGATGHAVLTFVAIVERAAKK
ncbi:MAG: leucyl aminopeptidase [Polyangiaceae bacterium]